MSDKGLIFKIYETHTTEGSQIAQLVKNPPAMQETPVQFLSREDPLQRERLPIPVFWPGEFLRLHGKVGYNFCCIQKSVAKTSVEISPMFSSSSFICWGFTFVFNSFSVSFCECHKIGLQFHSFTCAYPVFSMLFIAETILFPLSTLDPWTTWVWTLWVHLLMKFFNKLILQCNLRLV